MFKKHQSTIFILLLIIFLIQQSIQFDHITKAYEMYTNNNNIIDQIATPNEVGQAEQKNAYQKQYLNLQFESYRFDPTLSGQYKLSTIDNKINDSIWLLGQAEMEYLIEVTVDVEHDAQTHLAIGKGDIFVKILESSTGSVQQNRHVLRHSLFTLAPSAKLFKIQTRLNIKQKDQASASTVFIRISKRPTEYKRQQMDMHLKRLQKQVNELCDNGMMIFLDSLQDWNIIEMSSYLYESHEKDWKKRSILELGSFVIIGTIQLIYLWKVIKVQSVI